MISCRRSTSRAARPCACAAATSRTRPFSATTRSRPRRTGRSRARAPCTSSTWTRPGRASRQLRRSWSASSVPSTSRSSTAAASAARRASPWWRASACAGRARHGRRHGRRPPRDGRELARASAWSWRGLLGRDGRDPRLAAALADERHPLPAPARGARRAAHRLHRRGPRRHAGGPEPRGAARARRVHGDRDRAVGRRRDARRPATRWPRSAPVRTWSASSSGGRSTTAPSTCARRRTPSAAEPRRGAACI